MASTLAATHAASRVCKARCSSRRSLQTATAESEVSVAGEALGHKTRQHTHTLFSLWPIVLHPWHFVIPIDHRSEIKGAVGAARGTAGLKQVQTHAIDQWVIVGTLSLGVVAALLALVLVPPEERTLCIPHSSSTLCEQPGAVCLKPAIEPRGLQTTS